MINKLCILLAGALLFSSLGADEMPEYRVAVRGASFFPQSKKMRSIYTKHGVSWQVEVSKNLSPNFDLWVNGDYFKHHGGFGSRYHSSHIRIINGSIGVKFLYKIRRKITLYLGAGTAIAHVHVRNRHEGHTKSDHRHPLGVVAKSGVYYSITKRIFADLFVDYIYQPTRFAQRANLGGVKMGLGIGYCW